MLTLGRNARRSNILASDELLASRGVTVHEINRGGDVTYHGPGQLVGYPIFDLRTLRNPSGGRMGPVDFVRGMEEALIRLCVSFGVRAGRICGLTGVWCGVGRQPFGRESRQGKKDRRHRHSRRARHHHARLRLQRDHRPQRLRSHRSLRHPRPRGHQPGTRDPESGCDSKPRSHRPPGSAPLRPGLWRTGAGGREPGGAARCRRLLPAAVPQPAPPNSRPKTRRSRFLPRSSGCAARPAARFAPEISRPV